jgi:hypothetical protein
LEFSTTLAKFPIALAELVEFGGCNANFVGVAEGGFKDVNKGFNVR